MARRVHTVSSFQTPTRGRALRVSSRRDVGAAMDILPALMKQGFEYGEPILDWPPEEEEMNRYTAPLFEADYAFAQPGDLLLQTTRPPLNDDEQGDRKRVRPSFTDLEDKLFKVWRNYIARAARSYIELNLDYHKSLSPPFANRRHMKFFEAEGAPYKELNDCAGSGWRKPDSHLERRTAVFFLRQDEAWEGGPGLIGAWGMDGTATAVWAYRLGRDFSGLLATPGFVVAEMVNTGIPARPTNMLWAAGWEISIMLHEKLSRTSLAA
jgi:hypothetical protein